MLGSAVLDARTSELGLDATFLDRRIQDPVRPVSSAPYSAIDIANDNPRSLEEELAARLASAQRELSLVAMHLTPEFRTGTMRQLRQLLEVETWDEDDAHLDPQSFRSFVRAMATLRPSGRPMLGLSERGSILAMWATDSNRLSFEHLANDELRWFSSTKNDDGRDAAAGTTNVNRISRIIDAHGVGELIYGAR